MITKQQKQSINLQNYLFEVEQDYINEFLNQFDLEFNKEDIRKSKQQEKRKLNIEKQQQQEEKQRWEKLNLPSIKKAI